MRNILLLLAASFALAACSEDKPERVVHETRVINHYHTVNRPSPRASDNPADFEPVERPATYSR